MGAEHSKNHNNSHVPRVVQHHEPIQPTTNENNESHTLNIFQNSPDNPTAHIRRTTLPNTSYTVRNYHQVVVLFKKILILNQNARTSNDQSGITFRYNEDVKYETKYKVLKINIILD